MKEKKRKEREAKKAEKEPRPRQPEAKDRMTFDESESEGSTAMCHVDFNDDEEDAKWIGCDGCQQWWHASCLGMNDADIPDGCYYCADCAP